MGAGMMEIGLQIRKIVMLSIRRSYKFVCYHPFLVGMGLLVILLYRSFPFLFSIFISASPILVCTSILLGTLLSFGRPNIPEIEKEETRIDEVMSLKTGFSRDPIVLERNDSSVVESFTGNRKNLVEKSIEVLSSSVENEVTEVDKPDGDVVANVTLMEETSREIQFEKQVMKEEDKEVNQLVFEKRTELTEEEGDGEVVERMEDENAEVTDHEIPEESDSGLQWKKIDEGTEAEEEEEDDDDEVSDSGSDGAESSSPDASMADIIPMLDELHPLLDEDAPQPALLSHDGSDAASEGSCKSSESINELDEDTENHGDDDNDDDEEEEEEEETRGGKEDGSKAAITWTEDDQKNLMNLGTSELERNQRLENLIARRRARRDLRIMAEKNLIDLESTDLPFNNIPPISTARRNPFDIPYDPNDMGLPPIPGSAPSILLPRRNPFDLPYDPSEEKPDLKGDAFQQEFMAFHSKETLFRRHESFNVGPSFFGPPRHDVKFRPYFIPERMDSVETSYSSFHRQSSGLSESQVSSIPETESVRSAEDKTLVEEEFSQQEEELISNVAEHAFEHVERGSESSEDVDSVDLSEAENRNVEQNEADIMLGDIESHHEMGSPSSNSEDAATTPGGDDSITHLNLNARVVEESGTSSLSTSLEVKEEIFNEKTDEGLSSLEPREDNTIEESTVSQSSIVERKFNIITGPVDDSQQKEPVYDSSPPAFGRNRSSSSASSDLQDKISEMGLLPVLIKRTVSFTEGKLDGSNQDNHSNEEMLTCSSQFPGVNIEQSTSMGVTKLDEHESSNVESSQGDLNVNSGDELTRLESANNDSISTKTSSESESESMEDHVIIQEQSQVSSPSYDADVHLAAPRDVGESDDFVAFRSQYKSSEDSTLTVQDEVQPTLIAEQVSILHPYSSTTDMEATEKRSYDKQADLQFEQDQFQASSSGSNFHGTHEEVDEKLVYTHGQYVSEDKSMSELGKHLSLSDKSEDGLSSDSSDEMQESSIQVEFMPEIQESDNIVSANINPPLAHDLVSLPYDASERESPTFLTDLNESILDQIEHLDHPREATSHSNDENFVEEADEIKEIDEALLSELDTVGDFSVNDFRSNSSEVENHPIHVPHVQERRSTEFVEGNPIEVDEIRAIMETERQRGSGTEDEIEQYQEVQDDDREHQMSETLMDLKPVDNEFLPRATEVEHVDSKSTSSDEAQSVKIEVDLESSSGSASKQTGEEHVKETIVVESHNPEHEDVIDSKSGLPVVEARSIEDIVVPSSADDRLDLPESSFHAELIPEEIRDTNVLEARSLEDTNLDLKQVHEEIDDERHTLHNLDGPDVMESNDSNSDLNQTHSISEFLEARSVEDIDLALKQFSEGIDAERRVVADSASDGANVVEPKLHEDGSVVIDKNEAGFSKEIETGTSAPDDKDGDEKSKLSDDEGKKADSEKEK